MEKNNTTRILRTIMNLQKSNGITSDQKDELKEMIMNEEKQMNSLIVNSSVLTEEEIEEALVALSNKQDLMITDKETHNIENDSPLDNAIFKKKRSQGVNQKLKESSGFSLFKADD